MTDSERIDTQPNKQIALPAIAPAPGRTINKPSQTNSQPAQPSQQLLQSSPTLTQPASSGPLNTNSPLALAAAAAVTPERLASFLLSHGPLPIRHITAHLALTVPGFGDLSLSKQRRLIVGVLEGEDGTVRFEKVGWGRWAAHRLESGGSLVKTAITKTTATKPAAVNRAAKPIITNTRLPTHRRRGSLPSFVINPPASPRMRPAHNSFSVLAEAAVQKLQQEQSGTNRSLADLASLGSSRSNSGTNPNSRSDSGTFTNSRSNSDTFNASQGSVRRRRSSLTRARLRFHDYDDGTAIASDSDSSEEAVAWEPRGWPHSETDEEDWRGAGAAALREENLSTESEAHSTTKNEAYAHDNSQYRSQGTQPNVSSVRSTSFSSEFNGKEEDVIAALVQLRSVS